MIKLHISKNVLRDRPVYKHSFPLLDWNNKIAKFPKKGEYYYADYLRYFNNLPLKDKKTLSTKKLNYLENF